MTKRKFGFLIFSQLMLLFGFFAFNIDKVQAKELNNIVSDIHVWKTNYMEVTPDESGVYPLSAKDSYSLQLAFDLADISSEVKDGDYFNFNIPAPLTVSNGSIELIDNKTGIAIGDGAVTSNGESQGGNVQVTIKNIAAYLEQESAQEVTNIKGTFYVSFNVTEAASEVPVTFKDVKEAGGVTLKLKVDEWRGWPDNKDGLSGENFAKYAGVVTNQSYNSAVLGKSGEWIHPWDIRVNASRKNYSSLTITDTIDANSKKTQFIPESLQVQATDTGFDNSYAIINPTVLTEGIDYTVTYSNEHKGMVINILNPGNRAFYIGYSTTSPKDGSIVGNSLSMSSPENSSIPVGDGHTETSVNVTRSSQVTTQGGTIQIETDSYAPVSATITANKVLTGRGLREGEFSFVLTSQDGSQSYRATNKADGTVSFTDLVFKQPGTYTYTLQEEEGSDLTVNYDATPKQAVVEVSDNGSGQLEAKITSESMTIMNSTVPSIVSAPGSNDSNNNANGDNNASGNSSGSSNPDNITNGNAGSSGDNNNNAALAGANGSTGSGTNRGRNQAASGKGLPRTGDSSSPLIIMGFAVMSGLALIVGLNCKKADT